MLTEMKSNLYNVYLPAMMWLRKDEADRLRDESRPIPFPKFDRRVAVSGKTYRQLAYDDLAIFAECKGQKNLSEEHSPTVERKSTANTLDELFLPSKKNGHDDTKFYPHTGSRPVQRHLHPAQRLPRSAKPIYALPACLVAGIQPSRTFQTSPAGSKSRDQTAQNLGAPRPPSKENYKSATSHSGTFKSDEHANLAPAKLRTGRRRSSAQTFDPVQFAQAPSHYELRRQADKQDLQSQISSSSELPPLRVVSGFRFSGIFPNLATKSSTPDAIPQSSRLGPHPRGELNKAAELRKQNSGPLDISAGSTSSEQQKGQQRCSTQKFDPVQSAQTPSHHNFSTQSTNQELQLNKSLPPFIPHLRPVSSFRLSGILPPATADLGVSSHSPETGVRPHTRAPKIKASRVDSPSFFGRNNDIALCDRDTLPSQKARPDATSKTISRDAFHKSIRRRKGHENLRMAPPYNEYTTSSTSHVTPRIS